MESTDEPLIQFVRALADHQDVAAAPYKSLSDENLLRSYQRGHDLDQLLCLYHADFYLRQAGATETSAALSHFSVAWNRDGYGMWMEIRRRGLEKKVEQLRYQDLRDGRQPNNRFDEET